MCLSAQIPLVESGTAGYLGQTSVIIPGLTECFDCVPKETPRTFPVCTIRTTPSMPIHCVVWAKEYLLNSLFGPETNEELFLEGEDEALIGSLRRESEMFKKLRGMAQNGDDSLAQVVFDKIFGHDIRSLLELKELWETRAAPIPLVADLMLVPSFNFSSLDEQQVWSLEQWISLLKHSISILRNRAYGGEAFQEIYFDKDDDDIMNFVSSAANLRAHVFGIKPLTSRFSLKSMAGNIIPAIATTNAIVAGQMTLHAWNFFNGHLDRLCNSFVTYGVRRGALFACEQLSGPSPSCLVCHVDRAIVKVDINKCTLSRLIDQVLSSYSALLNQKISLEDLDSVTEVYGARMVYDMDAAMNEGKTLANLDCGDSKFLSFAFLSSAINLLCVIDHIDGSTNIGVELHLLSAKNRIKPTLNDEKETKNIEEEDFEAFEPPAKMAKAESSPNSMDENVLIF